MARNLWRLTRWAATAAALVSLGAVLFGMSAVARPRPSAPATSHEAALYAQGRNVFRNDTFGDQAFWGGELHLQKAIEGRKLGGVGRGVSPKTALAVGLKVDANALPASVLSAIKRGKVNLNSPGTTLALLKLNAVVGVKGYFNREGTLRSVGITCAICHSTVNNSVAPGIGQRLDGWPNQDLNVGAIVSLAPNLKPIENELGVDEATVKKVLASWGPGKFDAELALDGKAFQPNGRAGATLIPPALGLNGVNLATWTGFGQMTYWNAFVANIEMHGIGNFLDARLDNARQFPVAARNGFGHVRHATDLITPVLGALQFYQLGLPVPKPPRGSYNHAAAARGKSLFDGRATCSTCHVPPTFSAPGNNLVTPAQVCEDSFEADRSPTREYRIAPLRSLFTVGKRGYFHDGRFRTLTAVVQHYNSCFHLHLGRHQVRDLVQYLKSL
jgi:mono/diheme cytochrome c family protein